jgi:hypothetical protein
MWDTPWWVNSNRSEGRYNALGDPPVQYWCTHPLGPAAEFLRAQGPLSGADLEEVRLRLWVSRLPADLLVTVDFDNASSYGIDPEALVGEGYGPTQALAAQLRSQGATGLLVPSAALPGTGLAVVFGPRLLFPYLHDPMDEEQIATAHVSDSFAPPEVAPHVRFRGTAHAALVEWRASGRDVLFYDPPVRG